MADHPLRPATDRRLGGPLPRQLANQTQDPLFAPGLAVPRFHQQHPSHWSHAVLPLLSERYSPQKGRFPTRYSPVCHAPCGTSDLHVLGTPPAFILSQDQTLKFHSELLIPNPKTWKKCSGRIFLLNSARHPKTPDKTLKGFLYLLSGFQRRSHAPQHSPKVPTGPFQHPAASTAQDIQTTIHLHFCKRKYFSGRCLRGRGLAYHPKRTWAGRPGHASPHIKPYCAWLSDLGPLAWRRISGHKGVA